MSTPTEVLNYLKLLKDKLQGKQKNLRILYVKLNAYNTNKKYNRFYLL